MSRPRVAVIVPCFNDGAFLPDAVRSVAEPEPVELVVVDDASTDPQTLAVLDRLRSEGVHVVRHAVNRGLSAARRTGLEHTRAAYVFPLDSDDLAVPGALAAMADRLDAHPDAAACFGDYAEFGTRSRVRRVPDRLDPYRIAFRNDYPVSSLFRRDAIEPLGAWQDVGGMVGYEDWSLWMSLAEAGYEGVHLGRGRTAVRRRLHGSRMLTGAGRDHAVLYAELRRTHPRLFADVRRHRAGTDLSIPQRWLYPVLFGRRPPFGLRTAAEELLQRLRIRGRR